MWRFYLFNIQILLIIIIIKLTDIKYLLQEIKDGIKKEIEEWINIQRL